MEKSARKPYLTLFAALAFILLLALPLCADVSAASAVYHDIDITALLNEDGSARVTEVWSLSASDGTESYIKQGNLNGGEISELSVSDESGRIYAVEQTWDLDRSLEEKAGKCGYNLTNNGVELCWGLGSYGDHVYTVSYTVTRVVAGFDDYCGFNRRFVNDSLGGTIEHVRVAISKPDVPFTEEDVKVWAFGFDGTVFVIDGAIVAETRSDMDTSRYVNVMAQFPRAMFTPELLQNGPFESLKEQAFAGSEYDTDTDGNIATDIGQDSSEFGFGEIAGFLFALICPTSSIALVFFAILKAKNGNLLSGTRSFGLTRNDVDNIDYCRDIPYGGDLAAANYALINSGEQYPRSGLLGAYLLRWTDSGLLKLCQTPKPSFFGGKSDKLQSAIEFCQKPYPDDDGVGKRLYHMIRSAAGNDKLLEENEFSSWMSDNYEEYYEWDTDAQTYAEKFLETSGDLVTETKKGWVFSHEVTSLTDAGTQNIRKLLGFKKYLSDFTIINERSAAEVELWDEYLVFAALFGIADKVAEQFKDLYPKYFERYESSGPDMLSTILIANSIANSASSAANSSRSAAESTSGGGGSS
ncbi:MAG: DUF2207 domain-containing protein, partial [Oscillospiraceae bacterium]